MLFHFEVKRPADDNRRVELAPIKESHGINPAQSSAAFSRYLRTLEPKAAERIGRTARVVKCRCHWSHVPALVLPANALRDAMERSGRADTAEAYLADMAAIERHKGRLAELGADPDAIEAELAERLARAPQ